MSVIKGTNYSTIHKSLICLNYLTTPPKKICIHKNDVEDHNHNQRLTMSFKINRDIRKLHYQVKVSEDHKNNIA